MRDCPIRNSVHPKEPHAQFSLITVDSLTAISVFDSRSHWVPLRRGHYKWLTDWTKITTRCIAVLGNNRSKREQSDSTYWLMPTSISRYLLTRSRIDWQEQSTDVPISLKNWWNQCRYSFWLSCSQHQGVYIYSGIRPKKYIYPFNSRLNLWLH